MHKGRPKKRGTKTQRLARSNLARNMLLLAAETWLPQALHNDIPDAWHTLELDVDHEEPKEKVTLYLDRSVAKFYRAMGQGYQARINRLLATWAQMKLAEELRPDLVLQREALASVADQASLKP